MGDTATILVVDDHPELLEMIRLTLQAADYGVLAVNDGLEALQVLEIQPVDLILADIAMPGLNGYQLYQRVRENPAWLRIPFIFLTARALDSDIRYGKEMGVDDYLTKPIQPEDLLAVVRGKLRRAQQQLAGSAPAPSSSVSPQAGLAGQKISSRLAVGRLEVEPGQHRAWLAGEPLTLSAREFMLLEHLTHRAGQICSASELIKITHQIETDAEEASALLRPFIRSLRRKLGYPPGDMGCIETVRGVGYRLISLEE